MLRHAVRRATLPALTNRTNFFATIARSNHPEIMKRYNDEKGLCMGLAMLEVTENDKGTSKEAQAVAFQLAYTEYTKQMREQNKHFDNKEHLLYFKNLLIASNKLAKVSDSDVTLKFNCSPANAVNLIMQKLGTNTTFLVGIEIMGTDGKKQNHLVRFNASNGQECSFYDASFGKFTGSSDELIPKFLELLNRKYRGCKINLIGIPRIELDHTNDKNPESQSVASKKP